VVADAWLDGLARAIAEPHAGVIAEVITTRFGELSEAQASRLTALQQQLATAEGQTPAPNDG
jgi:hypothetical protein